MKHIYVLLIALLFSINIFAQICQTEELLLLLNSEKVTARNMTSVDHDWTSYSNYDPKNTPTKYVRVSFHVMQKSDGSGNFPDNQTSRTWLSINFMNNLNLHFKTLQPMTLCTSCPYYSDARIQFSLDQIYFWKDDTFHNNENFLKNFNSAVYRFVKNNTNVTNRESSVHIFLTEAKKNGSGTGGGNIVTLSGLYSAYATGNPNVTLMKNLCAHELGHCLGLDHTWDEEDHCGDTPLNPGGKEYWSHHGDTIVSNNMMDYNAYQNALTECQLNRMHFYLLGNDRFVVTSNCVISGVDKKASPIEVEKIVCSDGATLEIPSLQFGVTASWNSSPSTSLTPSSGTGNLFSISPKTTSNTPTTITFTLGYGKYGDETVTTKVVTNKLNSANTISGSLNGLYYGKRVYVGTSSTAGTIADSKKVNIIAADSIVFRNGFSTGENSIIEAEVSSNCQ